MRAASGIYRRRPLAIIDNLIDARGDNAIDVCGDERAIAGVRRWPSA